LLLDLVEVDDPLARTIVAGQVGVRLEDHAVRLARLVTGDGLTVERRLDAVAALVRVDPEERAAQEPLSGVLMTLADEEIDVRVAVRARAGEAGLRRVRGVPDLAVVLAELEVVGRPWRADYGIGRVDLAAAVGAVGGVRQVVTRPVGDGRAPRRRDD